MNCHSNSYREDQFLSVAAHRVIRWYVFFTRWLAVLTFCQVYLTLADDIDLNSRVETVPDGSQYCLECEQNLDICTCFCPDPKCTKPYRKIKKNDGASSEGWIVTTEGCCQCHLDENNRFYCRDCHFRHDMCACEETLSEILGSEYDDKENRPPPLKQQRVTIPLGEGVFARTRSNELFQVPGLEQVVPDYDIPGIIVPEADNTQTVVTSPGDIISASINSSFAIEVNNDDAEIIPVLDSLFSGFNVQITPNDVQHTLLQVTQYVGTVYPVNQPAQDATPPSELALAVILINDGGTLRLVLIFCKGTERLIVFRNIHGLIETHITNDPGLQVFFSLITQHVNSNSLNNFPAFVPVPLILQQPVANIDELWATATRKWQQCQAQLSLDSTRSSAARSGFGTTTRRRERGIVIHDHSPPARQSVSQTLSELFNTGIRLISDGQVTYSPDVGVVTQSAIENDPILLGQFLMPPLSVSSFVLPSQYGQAPNLNFDLKTSFMSDQQFSELSGISCLAFVMSLQGSTDFPLIIFVTMGQSADLINTLEFDQTNSHTTVSQSIVLPPGGFLRLQKYVIARINNNYQIRLFTLRDPDSEN